MRRPLPVRFSGVNRLIGVRWLEALPYPKTFTVDRKADVKQYFKLSYQRDP
jgi:iron complex transport system substrate-binding protein